MQSYSFQIVIEKEPEDPGFLAYSPTLPGCFGRGDTVDEARESIRTAIEQHVAALVEHGDPVPQGVGLVSVEELRVGLPA